MISRTGAMAVVDCGRKSIGIDRAVPELVGTKGAVRFEHGEHFVHEEHTALMLDDEPDIAVGVDRAPDARLRADDGEPLRLLLRGRWRRA